MSLESAGDLASSFGGRHQIGKRLLATKIVEVANSLSEGRFQAVSFRSGRLAIAVEDSGDRYLLQNNLSTLIAEINSRLGQPLVKEIRFRLAG